MWSSAGLSDSDKCLAVLGLSSLGEDVSGSLSSQDMFLSHRGRGKLF